MVRVVALPFSRGKWVCSVSSTQQALSEKPRAAAASNSVQALYQSIVSKVQASLQNQWKGLEAAPAGSIKNRLHRLALSVLSREDITESFLKDVPVNTERLTIIGPATGQPATASPEKWVRRSMRLMLRQQEAFHHCRLVTWGAALVPLAPLGLLPIPNIPMYYAGYRTWSHYKALQGARTLIGLFASEDQWQKTLSLDPAATTTAKEHRCQGDGTDVGTLRHVSVVADSTLNTAAQSISRGPGDMDDSTLEQAAERFDVPDLPDRVSWARKAATSA